METLCVLCAVGAKDFYVIYMNLRRSVAGLSPRRPGFDTRPVYVRTVVDKGALGQIFLPVLRFYPVTTIPLVLHTDIHLQTALMRKLGGRSLGTFKTA
jgi:hypothetical protein